MRTIVWRCYICNIEQYVTNCFLCDLANLSAKAWQESRYNKYIQKANHMDTWQCSIRLLVNEAGGPYTSKQQETNSKYMQILALQQDSQIVIQSYNLQTNDCMVYIYIYIIYIFITYDSDHKRISTFTHPSLSFQHFQLSHNPKCAQSTCCCQRTMVESTGQST